ncbi:type II toxin-antitoxin system RelE/ParE family toxin [Microvirga sp. BT291]|nr:type II toxin-antitoxin system RelE/ParE family toxin [Microvirga pudoricolor]MBM6594660.1 type II toxin-antitoxin system RelE/ParE family toxin [Microvirga pudoricolor]
MLDIRLTPEFRRWLSDLTDHRAVARIVKRIDRMAIGNPGDIKSVGGRVMEMRIDYGPGYRVYYVRRGAAIIVLLCGGDKRMQAGDIAKAKALATELQD